MSIDAQANDYIERLKQNNLLSRISAAFGNKELKHYLPLRQEIPTELDNYQGKYTTQADFLYFKNMMKTEHYAEKKVPLEWYNMHLFSI